MATLEVCIESAAGLQSCIEGNADRIELCSALDLGGLTPSAGLMTLAAGVQIPVYAMIRPRAGNFHFNNAEIDIMCKDIEQARSLGLAGVVLGATDQQGKLNVTALKQLCSAAGQMKKTLHRVIDTLNDPLQAVEQAIALGLNHILSSGGAISAQDGAGTLAEIHRVAAGRIDIIAGAGLTPDNMLPISLQTGITSFHSSCRKPIETNSRIHTLGFAPSQSHVTDSALIKEYKQILITL